MAVTVATACCGTDIIRSESPEGPICDDLVFMVLDDGGGREGSSRRAPHLPVSVDSWGRVWFPGAEATASGRAL